MMEWKFLPADASRQKRTSKALVKPVKKVITVAVGESVMTFSKLQKMCFEAATPVNERPIGRHSTSLEYGTYLCPNDLLLGRPPLGSLVVPSERHETKSLFRLCLQIVDAFWRKWTSDFFPSLIVQQKWHTKKRNLRVGDVVLI